VGDVGEYDFDWDRVENPLPSPLDALCAVRVAVDDDFAHRGTGTLIQPNLIITAAHVVDLGQERVAHDGYWELNPGKFYAVRGLNKGVAHGTEWIDRVIIPVEFPQSGTQSDVAVLKARTNFNGMSALVTPVSLDSFGRYPISVPGYPSHWDQAKADGNDIRIGKGTGGVLPPKPWLLTYSADTFAGHSGAPVFASFNNSQFAGYVGIHTEDGGILYNVGVRFTQDTLSWLNFVVNILNN
jgi:hypothetical protein